MNASSEFEDFDPVEAAYGADKFARLLELKAKYDPHNLFRGNARIVPGD